MIQFCFHLVLFTCEHMKLSSNVLKVSLTKQINYYWEETGMDMMMFEQVTFLKPLKQILVTIKSVRRVKGVEAHICGCSIIPGFCSMKWSGVPLLSLDGEICPSQVLLASSILLGFTGSMPVPYYSCILSGGENPPLPPPHPPPWGGKTFTV